MITVIIPTKDRPGDLLACLQGLARQENFELLSRIAVVDDGSRFSYENLALEFAKRNNLPLIWLKETKFPGAASARNQAAKYAIGEIIAFLDDDAVPANDWLKVIANRMSDTLVTAITGRILPLDHERIFSRARQLRYEMRQRQALLLQGPVHFLAGGNSAIRRDAFERLEGFNLAFTSMHDRELVLRMQKEQKYCYYAHDLLIYHRHYKGLGTVLRQSFVSGYYRLQLERHHSQVKPWSLKEQIQTFSKLARAAQEESHQAGPAIVASITELFHTFGYLWYYNFSKLKTRVLGERRGLSWQ